MGNPATIGGKYAVVRRLGKGGMGTVFECIEDGTGQRVAVKVIAADLAEDPTLVTRFHREARTVASLDTPHVVKVFDTGVDAETQLPFITMEYLEGEDLRQLLKRLGPLPAELALRIAAQACRALDAAHGAKILHRDIKPANLYLAQQNGHRVVKLLDFGVAKMQHDGMHGDAEMTNLTRTGSMIGSPLYMSPEQAKGYKNIDGRSDLWSLGVVLYQMLCGKTPHRKIDELGELLVRICTEPPPPIQRRAPWVPPSVVGLLRHVLAMEADDRIPTAAELLDSILVLLPNGDAIPEEALRPLSEAEKAVGIERTPSMEIEMAQARMSDPLGMSGTNPSRLAPIFTHPGARAAAAADAVGVEHITGHSDAPAAGRVSTLTHGATSVSGESPSQTVPPEKKTWRIAAVGLLAGGLAAGLYFGLARPSQSQGEAGPSGPQGQVADSARPRTVKLVVLPKDAKVEIDGAAAEVADGVVEIKGTLGSVHKVRVTAGADSKQAEVAVTENGPVPAKIEVEAARPADSATSAPAASASASATASATAVTQPAGGSYYPKPKPSATTAPTAPTTVQTGRTLRDDR